MRHFSAILLALVVSAAPLLSGDKSWNEDLKQKKSQAQTLIAEARAAEEKGDLPLAESKFSSANTLSPSKEASQGIVRIHRKRVDALVAEAQKLYQAADYPRAILKLKDADGLQAQSPRILQSLAASYYKLGDRATALDYLDQCKDALPPDSPERSRIDQYRSMVITGEKPELPVDTRAAAADVNSVLASRPPRGEEVKDYRNLEAGQEAARCKALEQNEAKLLQTAPALFDLGKCAQEEGRFADARRYFARYLEVAPQSLDAQDVRLRIQDLDPLLAIQGGNAAQLHKLYAQAYRLLLIRQYGQAMETYRKAESLVPDYPQTTYKIAMLYRAMGKVPEAMGSFRQYLDRAADSQTRAGAAAILEGLPAAKTEFDAHLAAGRDLLLAGKVASAAGELSKAQQIFPLALDVNSLLAQVYLNGNNPPAARFAMDAVFSQGAPVYFYAEVASSANPRAAARRRLPDRRRAKIEIENDRVRVIYLEAVNPQYLEFVRRRHKKGETAPPAYLPSEAASLDDKQANLAGSSRAFLPENSPDLLAIPLSAIQAVWTDADAVAVSFDEGKTGRPEKPVTLRFYPQVSSFTPPDAGWPARKFANTYTRMFSQYLGFDGVKLGPEHMSAGEKWAIVGEIAMAAASEGQAMSALSRTLNTALVAYSAYSSIHSKIETDRQMAHDLDFKLIPPEPLDLVFRADDFK